MESQDNSSYATQLINDVKGKGMICTKLIQKEDIIFVEKPMVSSQFLWSKTYGYKACDYCLKSLEASEGMAQRLTQDGSLKLPEFSKQQNQSQTITCDGCHELFCSEDCLHKARNQYHKITCPVTGDLGQENIEDLEETWKNIHFPPETSSIQLIIKMIAKIKQSENPEETFKQFSNFCSATHSHNKGHIHKLLGEKFENQIEILRQKLIKCFPPIENDVCNQWLTDEGFASLLAMLGTNQQGIGTSAIDTWVRFCDNVSDLKDVDKEELDDFIDKLYDKMYEISGEFLNCEGSGLYRKQSACNHSCQPNAEVEFLNNNHKLTLRALEDIHPGEEITISYISECHRARSRHSRQKYLKENYLFECLCTNCENEKDEPDITSDESDNSEGENLN